MSNFLPKNVFALFGSLGGFVGFCQLQSSLKAEESKPKNSKSDFHIEEINNANDKSARKIQEEKLQKLITETKNLCWLKMTGSAIPGLVIAVSVDGKTVFRHGFGYADVENKVLANSSHVFRIGKTIHSFQSISNLTTRGRSYKGQLILCFPNPNCYFEGC